MCHHAQLMYRYFTCTYVCILHVCLVPIEVRRRHWIFWNWNYRLLWTVEWFLGVDLSPGRSASALILWYPSTNPFKKKKKKTGSYYVAQTGFKLSLTSASCWDCRHVPPHQACEWLFNQENDLRPTYPDYPITERGLCASEIQQFWTFLTRLDRWLMIEVDWTPTVGLFSFNSCCLESQNCKLTGKAAGGLPFTHLTTWDGRKTGLWLTAPCLKCHFWRL